MPSAIAPHDLALGLFRPERAADGENELAPLSSLAHWTLAARLGPFVRLGLAVIRRNAPLLQADGLVLHSCKDSTQAYARSCCMSTQARLRRCYALKVSLLPWSVHTYGFQHRRSSNAAGVFAQHWLACFAAIGLREFGHIGDDPVDAVFQRRVRVGDGAFALGFGTHVAASPLSESHEKALIRTEPIQGLQFLAFLGVLPSLVCEHCATQIGHILS